MFKDGTMANVISQLERPGVVKCFVITAHISEFDLSKIRSFIIVQKILFFRTLLAVVVVLGAPFIPDNGG